MSFRGFHESFEAYRAERITPGAERYATTQYRVAAGRVDRDQHRAYLIALATYEEGSLEDPEGGPYTRATALEALGELAVGPLVERVGEPAIFRFFEDPGRDWRAWHEPFETTFGLTAEAFTRSSRRTGRD